MHICLHLTTVFIMFCFTEQKWLTVKLQVSLNHTSGTYDQGKHFCLHVQMLDLEVREESQVVCKHLKVVKQLI